MHIFIDESGSFAAPPEPRPSVSCVAALVVPDRTLGDVATAFRMWKRRHGFDPGKEVKGSALDEPQIADLIALLRRYPVLLEVYAVDMGMHVPAHIAARKEEQARMLTASLTEEHHPNFIREAEDYAEKIRRVSDPLFVQMVLNIELVNAVLDLAPTYYGMRLPAELAAFRWVVDAKQKKLTDYEDAWRTLAPPALQDKSFKSPRPVLPGVEYSHLRRRYQIPAHLVPEAHRRRAADRPGPGAFTDAGRLVWDDFRFGTSDQEPGLQIVDILANAVRRAIHGKLRETGWGEIGSLFVDTKDGPPGVRLCAIKPGPGADERCSVPYAHVLHAIAEKARPLPTPAYLKWLHSGRPDPYARRTTPRTPPSDRS